jgi:hypothetical protein
MHHRIRQVCLLALVCLLTVSAAAFGGVLAPAPIEPLATDIPSGAAGVTDQVRAATLLVPFFEVGIDSAANPDDTLLVVTNRSAGPQTVHYEVWDVDGESTGLFDNVFIPAGASESISMRTLINDGDAGDRAALAIGAFYRGFVTFDAVTGNTLDTPLDASYPFSSFNTLTGWTYYTKLANGSANGLPMVHLEHVGSEIDSRLRDFYQDGVDNREEMDADSRRCASARTRAQDGVVNCASVDEETLTEIHYRVFLGGPLNGRSRVILFAWSNGEPFGPSIRCDTMSCDSEYPVYLYNESGDVYDTGVLRFDHVVNVIELDSDPGAVPGFLAIQGLPDVLDDTQIYGFSFNSARPGSAALNWDAIFEATIIP